MSREIYGLIHDYYPRERVISIYKKEKIEYYYFSKSLESYIKEAMGHAPAFIDAKCSNKLRTLKHYPAYEIIDVNSIFYSTRRGIKTIYTQALNSKNLIEPLTCKRFKMFMDLELTMPEYSDRSKFSPEILQIGCVIIDENDNLVNYYDNYVKTNKPVTQRAMRFLSIDETDLASSIEYKEFYSDFKRLIEIYNPLIMTWGADKSFIDSSFKLHNLPPLKVEYIDLCNINKRYFKLKDELGLFKALNILSGIKAHQMHNALTDAQATKEVYDSMKKVISGELTINLQAEIDKLKESKEI